MRPSHQQIIGKGWIRTYDYVEKYFPGHNFPPFEIETEQSWIFQAILLRLALTFVHQSSRICSHFLALTNLHSWEEIFYRVTCVHNVGQTLKWLLRPYRGPLFICLAASTLMHLSRGLWYNT